MRRIVTTRINSNWLLSRWCSGLACLQHWSYYLQGLVLESHIVELFVCNMVSPLTNQTPTLTSVLCAPIIYCKSYRGHMLSTKQAKKNSQSYDSVAMNFLIILWPCCQQNVTNMSMNKADRRMILKILFLRNVIVTQ